MKRVGIIPARYASTRFPGKPLAKIGDKSMIQRVYEQASASALDRVIVATDDERIEREVRQFGGEVLMTPADLESGTERCAAAVQILENEPEIVINVQGDEPFIDPGVINQLLMIFEKGPEAEIATLVTSFENPGQIESPHNIKVVTAEDGKALYFSRSAIPYSPEKQPELYLRHVGIYGYRSFVLKKIVALPECDLEKTERLEQLRWLYHGYRVYTRKVIDRSISVDTPEDLHAVEDWARKEDLL